MAHARIKRGTGVPDPLPLKNHKNIGFQSNTGPDPLKITKLPSQHSILGLHRPVPVSETPFKWRFAGGPMMPMPALSAILIVSPLIKKKHCHMAKLSGSAHGGLYIDDAHVDPRIVHED